jgi:hypothetical protein
MQTCAYVLRELCGYLKYLYAVNLLKIKFAVAQQGACRVSSIN